MEGSSIKRHVGKGGFQHRTAKVAVTGGNRPRKGRLKMMKKAAQGTAEFGIMGAKQAACCRSLRGRKNLKKAQRMGGSKGTGGGLNVDGEDY